MVMAVMKDLVSLTIAMEQSLRRFEANMEFEVNVPQDRQSSFELQVFPKCCAKQEKLFLSVLLGST